jgi:hypothetical protein
MEAQSDIMSYLGSTNSWMIGNIVAWVLSSTIWRIPHFRRRSYAPKIHTLSTCLPLWYFRLETRLSSRFTNTKKIYVSLYRFRRFALLHQDGIHQQLATAYISKVLMPISNCKISEAAVLFLLCIWWAMRPKVGQCNKLSKLEKIVCLNYIKI